MDALDITYHSGAFEEETFSYLLQDNTAVRTESWMMNHQTSGDELHQEPNQVGTSRGANRRRKALGTQDKIQRKRMSDKKYREQVKEGKKKMQDDLDKLTEENKRVTFVNHSIKNEIHSMNLKLQSAAVETKQLQTVMSKLRLGNRCQQVLMEAFLPKMVGSKDSDHQLEMLKREISELRQTVASTGWMEEAVQLLNRIADLEHQHKDLTVQVDALSEKICRYKDLEEIQA